MPSQIMYFSHSVESLVERRATMRSRRESASSSSYSIILYNATSICSFAMSILEDLDDSCTPFRLFTGILFFHPPRSSGKAENGKSGHAKQRVRRPPRGPEPHPTASLEPPRRTTESKSAARQDTWRGNTPPPPRRNEKIQFYSTTFPC